MVSRDLVAEVRRERTLFAGTCAALWAGTATYVLQAVLLAHALAGAVRGDVGAVAGPLVAVGATALVRAVLTRWHARLAGRLGREVRLSLREDLLAAVLSAGRRPSSQERDGAVRLSLTDGVEGIDAYVSSYLPALAQVVVLCPVLLGAVAVLSPWAALALAGCVVVALGAPRWWDRLLVRRGAEHWDTYESLASDYLEALQAMSTLRALGAVGRAREALQERSDRLHRATVRTLRVSLVDTAVVDLAVQAGVLVSAAVAVLGSTTGGGGAAAAPATYLLLLLSSEVLRPVRELSRQWHAGYLGTTSVGPVRALLAQGHRRPAASSPAGVDGGRGAGPGDGGLVLEGVRVAHPGGPPVLRGVDLHVAAGEVVAVVGPSGAGKSTLLDVVMGLVPPDAGTVTTGRGAPVALAGCALASQDTYLFAGTVAENLRAGRPGASHEQVVAAARAAAVHDEVLGWDRGYETVLGEGGGTLSGGQRQRLSLARAMLTGRPVLLLDEPTSALDDARARTVMRSVREYVACTAGRSALVVTHREEGLDLVDRVLRLDDGRLGPVDRTAAVRAGGA